MTEPTASPFFGIALSILAYWVGVRLQKRPVWWCATP